METLKDFLGDWAYSNKDGTFKLWVLVPRGSTNPDLKMPFMVYWKTLSVQQYENHQQGAVSIAPAQNLIYCDEYIALARALSHKKGGYKLITPYTGEVPGVASLTIGDLYAARKRKIRMPSIGPIGLMEKIIRITKNNP